MILETRLPQHPAASLPAGWLLHALASRAEGRMSDCERAGMVLTFAALVLLSLTCLGRALAG